MTHPKLSPTSLDARHPGAGRDLNWLLDDRARNRPGHPFVVWEPFEGPAETWTYQAFRQRVLELASALHQRGLRAGEVLLVHLDNGPEFELLWFACARLGAVVVTTNTRSAGDELRFFVENSRAVAAVTSPEHAGLFSQHARGLRWLAVTGRSSTGALLAPEGGDERFDALVGKVDAVPALAVDPWRIGSVQYTSGTTSRPKGVVWTQGNALFGAQAAAGQVGLTPQSVHFAMMPQFHTNARIYSILSTLWVGATVVLTPKFSASRFWVLSGRHGCTHSSLLRFFYRVLMQREVPPHRYQVWNAGTFDPAMEARFGVKGVGHYGSTELVGNALVTDLHGDARAGTVGQVVPGYGVRLVTDDGRAADRGEVAHLQVRGTPGVQIFQGYLNDPDATLRSFTADGWFMTGDRAVQGEDGAYSYVDRMKDMLKVGGENVAAAEVERVLLGVPGVYEAAVVGKPDELRGDVAVAFVLAVEGLPAQQRDGLAERVRAACTGALADFKVPREVYVVDELPRVTLHKINKAELRRRLAAGVVASPFPTDRKTP